MSRIPTNPSAMLDERERGVYVTFDRVDALGGITPAWVFSHIAYWFQKMGRPVYKSTPELADELRLSASTIERAVRHLRELGVLTAHRKMANGAPVNHYAVDYDRHDDLIRQIRGNRSRQNDGPDGPPQNDGNGPPQNDGNITESTNIEYKQEKPSSASADALAEKPRPSAKEAPGVPASPNGPKAHPPSSAAPPSQLTELLEIWNEHRGKLPALRSLNAKRTRLLKRLVRESEAAKLDPREVVKAAALEVANDPHYLQNRYTLENVIQSQSNRLGKLIDALLEAPPGEELVAGQLYTWPRDPSRPWAGELLGAFTGEVIEVRGRTFAVMDLDGTQVRAPVDELEPRK